jgi:peptidoglycan/LPS O-acetylase OafA/YrhL
VSCRPESPPSPASRLLGIDALRGLAALSVVLFHYTTRFDEKHGHAVALPFGVDSGFLGVQLFFAISGFVIFLTLDRLRTPAEFLVSRFSRLFPAFWAALLLTWLIEWLARPLAEPLPPAQALLNLGMLHGYFGVPSVDGVYWTLQVELFFYLVMFLLWLAGALHRPLWAMAGWLLLCAANAAMPAVLGRGVPHALQEALLLDHFPHFALGIAVYLGLYRDARQPRAALAIAALALAVIAQVDGGARAAWALLFGLLLVLGLRVGRRAPRGLAPLVWLGSISYPLYLLHQDIGYVALQWLQARGVVGLASVAVAIVLALVLATLVHRLVEEPALRGLRRRLRPLSLRLPPRRRGWLWSTALLTGVLLLAGVALPRLGG